MTVHVLLCDVCPCVLDVPVPISSGRSTPSQYGEDAWHDTTVRTTIRADNEVEAHKEANNYKVRSGETLESET